MVENYQQDYKQINVNTVEKNLSTLRNASILLRELEEYFASFGLSQLKFLVLIVIDRDLDKNSLTSAEISERIDVSKSVLSRSINKLIDDNLLKSQSDGQDGRTKQLSLTKKGHKTLQSLLPDYFTLISKFEL